MVAQFAALVYSLPGRADHHTLIVLVFTLTLGLTARVLRDPDGSGKAVLAGAFAGLGIWLSPELLLVLAACFGALAWGWFRSGERTRSADVLHFSAALCIAIAAALLLEYPPTLRARGIVAALGGFALASPGFFAGPLAGIDPRARIVLVNVVAETGVLLPTDAQGVLSLLLYLGWALVALPVAVSGLRRERPGPLAMA